MEEAIFLTKFFNCLAEGKTSEKKLCLKDKFHLLVSSKPTNGDDAQYAEYLREFVKKHNLPVTIGLDDLVSLEREVDPRDPAKIRKYGIVDIYRVADLVINTSILEGFDFVYIESWILDRPVIGRNIPVVTPDFQAAGMKLGHLYTVFLVEGKDFKDIGQEKSNPDVALQETFSKILKLDDPKYLYKFIESNETTIFATLKLFDEERKKDLVAKNKEVVEKVYSRENVGRQLYEVITSD